MNQSLYAEKDEVVFWKGSINEDGTPGPDYVEIREPIKEVLKLLATHYAGGVVPNYGDVALGPGEHAGILKQGNVEYKVL